MSLRKRQETIHEYDTVRRTTCCNCPTGCGLKVFLKEGRIVDIFGDEEHPINKGSVCPKGLLSYYHLRNSKRLLHPQIRENLDQPFRSVTWEQALSFIAKRLKTLAKEKGQDSIFIYGDECSPFDYLYGGTLFAKHFGTQNIPSKFFPNAFGSRGILKRMFGVSGSQLLMNSPRDWANSRCILLYGCDLAATDPITFGPIVDARDRGAVLLVIDSKRTITASKATLALRVKPGSQSIILKGIIHLLIKKNMVDEDFLNECTSDFPYLKSMVEPYTPDLVAKLSWVKQRDIEKMADLIGRSRPFQVMAGDWFSRRRLSDVDLFMCASLVCLRGSVGIPGGGLNLLNVSPFCWEDLLDNYAGSSLLEKCTSPDLLCLEDLLHSRASRIGAIFWCGNPGAKLSDAESTKPAFAQIPLIVHLSSYPNESYHHSHVSLPVSSWLEYSGLVSNNNGRALQWHHKVIDPPGECKTPLEFWVELARFCNLREILPHGQESDGINSQEAIDYMLKNNPLTIAASVEKLDPETNPPGGLLWPCIEEDDLDFEESRLLIGRKGNVRGKNILFQKGRQFAFTGKRFPTESGKICFSVFQQIERGQCQEFGTEFEVDDVSDFPMMLITGVLVDYVDQFGYFTSDRDEWTKDVVVQLHPQVGKILGIKSGDLVTVENQRGSFTAPAWLNEEVDPRVIWCPEGIDPYQPHFGCASPYSLFEPPSPYGPARPFANVIIYKTGGDKRDNQQCIVEFLKELEAKT